MRRPALEPTTRPDNAVVVSTWYSVFGVQTEVDHLCSQICHGYYWLHIEDYTDWRDAIRLSRNLYAYRIVKCEMYYHNNQFHGIRGTSLDENTTD